MCADVNEKTAGMSNVKHTLSDDELELAEKISEYEERELNRYDYPQDY